MDKINNDKEHRQEELSYMPDYIYDENGSLIQIMFDRIEKK